MNTAPTPADSPIIATGRVDTTTFTERHLEYVDGQWRGWTERGPLTATRDHIIDWTPAIVTPTGRGALDDRDKTERVDRFDHLWYWRPTTSEWASPTSTLTYPNLTRLEAHQGPITLANHATPRHHTPYSAHQFSDAQFATHDDGWVAVRLKDDRHAPWLITDGTESPEDQNTDESMANEGWRIVA